jgi:ornithine cyclodeaminase/alanine dehydrogenase-like protein (mu-crystallin family)
MLSISDEFIRRELSMATVIGLVEQAFAADALGNAVTFPAIVDYVGHSRAHFGIKSGYLCLTPASCRIPTPPVSSTGRQEILGLKAGGYWTNNQERYGLPSHRATLLLIDPDNGEPLVVMSANTITRMRTAAAGAIAARYLARTDAKIVTVIGTGEQAHAQIEALRVTRPIAKIFVWGRRKAAVDEYATAWQRLGLEAVGTIDLSESLPQSDIIVTTTPSTRPLVMSSWISPGTHINAIGSDGAGKKELDPALVRRAKFVADKTAQSQTIGELQQVPPRCDGRELIYAELGQICAGQRAGRENDGEITVFDSSGVSFQDLVVAHYLLRQASDRRLGEVL